MFGAGMLAIWVVMEMCNLYWDLPAVILKCSQNDSKSVEKVKIPIVFEKLDKLMFYGTFS